MISENTSLPELMDRAYSVLLRELGPVNFVRVVRQLQGGQGDYTRERDEHLSGVTMEQVRELVEISRGGAEGRC